jgi:hypothetical protein
MIPTRDKSFYWALLSGLLLCAALYAEETIHFFRYGWHKPDSDARVSDSSKCQRVRGSSEDFECPIRGYGLALYRYKNPNDPKRTLLNDIYQVY